MKTLEEMIEHIERSIELSYIMAHRMYEMTALHLTVRDAIDLLPGLKQAQSERQQVKELSDSYKQAILDSNNLRDQLGEAQKELEAAKESARQRYLDLTNVTEAKIQANAELYHAREELEAARAEIADECAHYNQKVNELGEAHKEIERLTQAYRDALGLKAPTKSDEVK